MSDTQKMEKDDGPDKEQKASHWSEFISKFVDKIMDKDVSVTYTFDHLEIDISSARGPGGKELGGGKWIIDGKINISTSTTAHNNELSSSPSKYTSS